MSALSFGLGVWAVQVIGLLSYYTPITFQINMWMLIASLLVAFLGSLLSSWLYMIKKMSIISGILIGITLLMTHYILLFSLKSNIALQVQPWASLLSATISFVLGAYIVHAWFYVKTLEQNQMMKVMSSIVTGCGLAAMHYIHLAGYSLKEGTFIIRRWGQFLPYQEPFAGLVASVTLTILILFLLIAAYKKHAESHTNMIKEASYRSLFNYNPDIVCSISVNGFINVMNTKGKDVTGYAMHEMEHLPFLMLFPPDDAERIQHFFQQSLDGTSVHYDATLIKQNGENIYVEVTQMPIIVNGESHGIYVILKDITERKVAQEALCTLQSELALTMNQHDGVIFKLKK
ncbi:PAS domain S-box protein [Priestia flexa]